MVARAEVERALHGARTPAERVAYFGALLARDSRLGRGLIVVGGSAISVYTAGAYVSKDVDVIGPRVRLQPSLRRWGFRFEGQGQRGYWLRADLGLLVDIIDRPDYVGLKEGIRTLRTPYGPVRVAAVEDLIVRRLVFAKRDRRRDLMDQAGLLWVRYGETLDREYLDYQARYEDVSDLLGEVADRARVLSARRGPRRVRRPSLRIRGRNHGGRGLSRAMSTPRNRSR